MINVKTVKTMKILHCSFLEFLGKNILKNDIVQWSVQPQIYLTMKV